MIGSKNYVRPLPTSSWPRDDTSARQSERRVGRERYARFRDILIRAGYAAWNGDDQRSGWRLTAPPQAILSRIFQQLITDHSLIFKAAFEISGYPRPLFDAKSLANRTEVRFDQQAEPVRALSRANQPAIRRCACLFAWQHRFLLTESQQEMCAIRSQAMLSRKYTVMLQDQISKAPKKSANDKLLAWMPHKPRKPSKPPNESVGAVCVCDAPLRWPIKGHRARGDREGRPTSRSRPKWPGHAHPTQYVPL